MAKQVQLRRGDTTDHSSFTGAVGELTYDTQAKLLTIHDGSTVGGIKISTITGTATSIASSITSLREETNTSIASSITSLRAEIPALTVALSIALGI